MNPMKTDEPDDMPLTRLMSQLGGRVADLKMQHSEAMSLLGEIIATVTLPRNRDELEKMRFFLNSEGDAAMVSLLAAFDSWTRRYKELTGGTT